MIHYNCPKCEGDMDVPDSQAGEAEICPNCKHSAVVPQQVQPVSTTPPASQSPQPTPLKPTPPQPTPLKPTPPQPTPPKPTSPQIQQKKILSVRCGENWKQRLFYFDILMLGGAGLCTLSLLLDWASFGPFGIRVYKTDARWAAFAGVAAGVILLLHLRKGKLAGWACLVLAGLGGLAFVIAVVECTNISPAGEINDIDNPFVAAMVNNMVRSIDVGLGAYAIPLGSAALTFGSLAAYGQGRWRGMKWFEDSLKRAKQDAKKFLKQSLEYLGEILRKMD